MPSTRRKARPSPNTAASALPTRLDTPEALATHLAHLAARDPRLDRAIRHAGTVNLRLSPRGFEGMARAVCGQQLSVASARAIWTRVEALGATTPAAYLDFDEATLRATGLSRSKYETIRGLALAEIEGRLDYAHIESLPAEEAVAALIALKGIGPWTAELYLLFCTGHPDVFPAGDLALQKAVAHAFSLESRPGARELLAIAADWSPHRGAAALMFWRYFAFLKSPDAPASWDAL